MVNCKRCGRVLTWLESVRRGYGDECWAKLRNGDFNTRANPQDRLAPSDLVEHLGVPKCLDCDEDITEFYMYDHPSGYVIEGYDEPQWIYGHCNKCGYDSALWKLHRQKKAKEKSK